jgi:2-oxoisovalerate dehydrogenase E1 component
LGQDRVSISFFGDGAVSNGAFHEGINLATVWGLPVVFVNENNLYATEMSFSRSTKNTNVASKAAAYGCPGIQVDGNDVLAVYEVARDAIERARSGEGPTLIECLTYRTRPHAEGMRDSDYRTREEVAEWKKRCPIQRFAGTLESDGVATSEELESIEREISEMIQRADKLAKQAPWPDPSTLTDHVYTNG